jgi:hypothetical protein
MSHRAGTYESEGAAERRAQRELTERVGVRLVRRGNTTTLKWSTWKWRLGMRARPHGLPS